MATFATYRYFTALLFLILYFKTSTADPNSSFSFNDFGKDSNFESQIALYGDAKVVTDGGLSVQITGSSIFSAGRVMNKKPIRFVEGKPRKMVSFSSYFSFSLSPENGDGLAFVMVPIVFPLNVFDDGSFGMLGKREMRFLCVEFDTSIDVKHGDVNGNHVGFDVDNFVSVKVSNVSSLNLVLNSGEKLQAWIDYEASSRRLEVRLSKLGELKPVNPLLSYPIDLSRMWKEDEVFVGLSSSSGNSSQKSSLYSWSFKLRRVPHSMHSQPLDPQAFADKTNAVALNKRKHCVLKVLAALIFGTGFGALTASVVLYMWAIFGNRRPVVPEEYVVNPEFDYKKFNADVDKSVEHGKK